MFKLKEIICRPFPPPSPYPFQLLSRSQCPLHCLRLLCHLCGCCRCRRCQHSICLCCCRCHLHLCHCCHARCLCRRNSCCRSPLLFRPRTNHRLFAITVCCSYSLTFPRLYPLGYLGCNKLEPYPWPWWWHACHALHTSWYPWRHQSGSRGIIKF